MDVAGNVVGRMVWDNAPPSHH